MLESGKGEKVRHAMSALLVEVLTPVASVIKYEVSMPAFKKIVSTLYSHAYDQAKRKHSAVRGYTCGIMMLRYCIVLPRLIFHWLLSY